MVEAILLDSLLGLAIVLLIPLGVARGGLREVCSSAGLLLGVLLSQQWAPRWGDWVADLFGFDLRASRLVVAVATVLLSTAIIGYGASSAFTYDPGPGGKMFGAAIAVINGVVLAGFVVNSVATYVNNGGFPDVVEEGWVSRSLATGFDWVLLVAAGTVMLLSLMGMVVREREPADQQWMATHDPAHNRVRQVMPTKPYMADEATQPPILAPLEHPTGADAAPVKVREVRHWEKEPVPKRPDTITGWQRTWPKSATGERVRAPWEAAEEPSRPSDSFRKVPPAHLPVSDTNETLRDWVVDDEDATGPKPEKS